jgi:hypothetical protein
VALIVEDGTGRADAESFCSVAAATAYHAARGNTAWAALASDTVREQLLRKATDYMEQVYRLRWDGYKKTNTQALSWPRYDVPMRDAALESYYADNIVPAQVANACAELALKANTVTLAPDVGPQKKRVKVDVIETEYADGASQITQFRAIDNMLAPFLTDGSSLNISVVRA